jgi:hypothetical protein
MEPFQVVSGPAAPLMLANVDTDVQVSKALFFFHKELRIDNTGHQG